MTKIKISHPASPGWEIYIFDVGILYPGLK